MNYNFDQICETAWAGGELEACADFWDLMAVHTMTALYQRFKKDGTLTHEAATAEKQKIKTEWERARKRREDIIAIFRRQQEFYKGIEAAAAEYTKNPSIETADRLFETVYNLCPGGRLERRTENEAAGVAVQGAGD